MRAIVVGRRHPGRCLADGSLARRRRRGLLDRRERCTRRRAISRRSFRCCRKPDWRLVQQDLVTGSIRATADVEGTVGQPILHLVVESDEATVARTRARRRSGSGAPRGVDVRSRGVVGGATLDLERERSELAGLRATGQYDLKARPTRAPSTPAHGASSRRPTFRCRASSSLDYSGRGRGRMVFGKARLVSNLTVSQDVALGEIVADVDLQGDRATSSALARRSSTPSPTRPSGWTRRTRDAQSQRAGARPRASGAAAFELPVALDGTADIRIEAEGSLEQWRDGRASLEVTALDGHVQTLPVTLREPARVRYDDGRVVVERLEGSVGKTSGLCRRRPSASRAPRVLATDDAVLATLTGDLYDVAVAAAVAANATRRPRPSRPSPRARVRSSCSLGSRDLSSLPRTRPTSRSARAWFRRERTLRRSKTFWFARTSRTGCSSCAISPGAITVPTSPRPAGAAGPPDRRAASSTDRRSGPPCDRCRRHLRRAGPFVDASTISQVGGSLDAKLDLSSCVAEPGRCAGRGRPGATEPDRRRPAGHPAHADSSRGARRHRAHRDLGVGERRARRSN